MKRDELGRWFERFRSRGDAEALGQVFDRAAPKLLEIALHLTDRVDEAEDLVQATFVTAIEQAERFDHTRPLFPWLAGILAHHGQNLRRRRLHEFGLAQQATLGDGDTVGEVLVREHRESVQKAIEGLADPYRTVLRLHLLEGRNAVAIGQELQRASGTVRMQIHRGLRRLRRSLPASLLSGAGVLSMTGRGLALVRAEVLHHAASAASAGAVSALALGGVLVTKKLMVGAVALVGVWLAFELGPAGFLWGEREEESQAAEVSVVDQEQSPVLSSVSSEAGGEPERDEVGAEPLTPRLSPFSKVRFSGVVVDAATAKPLVDAAVWTGNSGDYVYWGPAPDHVLTDEEGRFEMEDRNDISSVFVRASGYALLSQFIVHPPPSDTP